MSRVVYYISTLFFILIFLNVEKLQEGIEVNDNLPHYDTTINQKNDDSCKESIDFLYGNHFINIVQLIDCNSFSKSSYIKLLFKNITILRLSIFNVYDNVCHTFYSFKEFFVTRAYFIYGLRKIVV